MGKWRCRLLGRPQTERDVEAENFWNAPDGYMVAYCSGAVGIAFVQVEAKSEEGEDPPAEEGWRLWKCEVLFLGPPIGILTSPTTELEARRFLAIHGVIPEETGVKDAHSWS